MSGVPGRAQRAFLAMAAGGLAALLSYAWLHHLDPAYAGGDLTWAHRGAQALLRGEDPYVAVRPYFVYPLPTALLAIPFTMVSAESAAPWLGGLCVALLAYAVTRDGYARLPVCVSIPCLYAVLNVQWSLLLVPAALVPSLGFLAVLKPNLGIACFAYRPSWRMVTGGLAIVLLSLILLPHWPAEWMQTLAASTKTHQAPITLLGGPILLLAAMRWRRPEARMLLALSCVPQSLFFYDQVLLWLVPRTFRESALLSVLSVAAVLVNDLFQPPTNDAVAKAAVSGPIILVLLYFPALVMVLRRPNTGPVPELLEPLAGRFAWGRRLFPASADAPS